MKYMEKQISRMFKGGYELLLKMGFSEEEIKENETKNSDSEKELEEQIRRALHSEEGYYYGEIDHETGSFKQI